MIPALSSYLSTLLVDRKGGFRNRILTRARKLREFDFSDREALRSAQNEKLADLLRHLSTNVPFYRERLPTPEKIDKDNAMTLHDSLPVIRKSVLQEEVDKFKAGNVSPVYENSTGGSTGTPMTFLIDDRRKVAGDAAHHWANGLAGWKYGEKIAMLWGADRDVLEAQQHWRVRSRGWLENIRWYNAFNMGEDEMACFHEELSRFRPHMIIAYAGSAQTYARYLQQRGIEPVYPLRGVISSAEILTTAARAEIESVFRHPVFDRYGSREFGPLAAECEAHQGMHINEMDCLLSIDSPDPHAQPGPLIVTYLENRAMPFVRYDTGDLGVLELSGACRCGRKTRRLSRVLGRSADTIRTRSGRLIHGEYFTHLLYGISGVREFQFIQESLDVYRLRLVADPGQTRKHERGWKKEIRESIGSEAELTIEYTEAIPVLPSGKRKFTVSLLEST